jgi:PleD family two-component response regulator
MEPHRTLALFRAADQALYSAKAAGRDRVAAGHLVAVS